MTNSVVSPPVIAPPPGAGESLIVKMQAAREKNKIPRDPSMSFIAQLQKARDDKRAVKAKK